MADNPDSTETPQDSNGQNKDWVADFQRIVAEGGLADIDTSGIDSDKKPSLKFIDDYESLIGALYSVVKKPNEKQMRALMLISNTSTQSLKLFVEDILEENRNNPDVAHILVELIKKTNDTRSEFLSSITNHTFGAIGEEALEVYEEDFSHMLQDGTDIVGIVVGEYAGHLTTDIEKLFSLAVLEYSGKKSTKVIKVAGIVGHHALDLAKITTGVVIGVVIANRITRD